MISPRWRKVLRDLWHNKTRTVLVVASIAVGVFAIGAMAGGRAILSRDLQSQYDQTHDNSARIFGTGFDEKFINSVRAMPEIEAAQGRAVYLLRINDDARGVRSNLILHGIDDFEALRVNTYTHTSGARVPAWRTMLIERGSRELFKVGEGDLLEVELPNGKKRAIAISGSVHDLNAPPPRFANFGTAYVSMETLRWLGFPGTYTEIRIVVRGTANKTNRVYIQSVVD
jgi:putative ABC transport system permease protein